MGYDVKLICRVEHHKRFSPPKALEGDIADLLLKGYTFLGMGGHGGAGTGEDKNVAKLCVLMIKETID